MVELVDIFPTVATLVGFKELKPCPAVSFKVHIVIGVRIVACIIK